MSASDLLFDTWAWWEYLHETKTGTSLRERFVTSGRTRLHTSAITLAELSARLHSDGASDRSSAACGAIRRMSHIWDVTADIAEAAGPARAKLRESSASASLADAVILVTAQRASARIVSADPAFAKVPGIVNR